MDSLPSFVFAFARFVARENRPFHRRRTIGIFPRRRTFGLAARRRNFGRIFNRRQHRRRSMNGGLRHRRAVLGAPRRRYGPGGGLRRRHNHRQHYHHVHRRVQNRNFTGTSGPSTRAEVPREEIQAIPERAVVPDVVAEGATEVDVVHEDEASASSITADADELLPPPPAFNVPPMEWLLGGPSAGWLVDDPERDFSNEELTAPSPPMYYYLHHGYGPCLPSPTPSGEEQGHFAPSGYDPVTEFFQPLFAVPVDASPAAIPNLNAAPSGEVEKEKNEDAAPSLALPTPSPEARVLLRRLDSAMAARPAGTGRGTRFPEALDLTGHVAELRLNEADHHSSSSVEWPSRRW